MSRLTIDNNFTDQDRAYTAIIDAHRDLDDDASHALNARLVLILANHVGDEGVLAEAIALARNSM